MGRRQFWLWRRTDDRRRALGTLSSLLHEDQKTSAQALDEYIADLVPPHSKPYDSPSLRRSRRQLEHMRQTNDHWLACRVHEILIARGLTHSDFSIAGGHTLHIPEVVSVTAAPPARLEIRTLPGQLPDDFTAHASAIAYDLGVAEVRVLPLGPSLIRLELCLVQTEIEFSD